MLESFLAEGSQCVERATPATIDRGGLSITDPCLGWEHTEALLLETAATLRAGGARARTSA
jgi:3-deoxy-7-phosphoheptulonate synthase